MEFPDVPSIAPRRGDPRRTPPSVAPGLTADEGGVGRRHSGSSLSESDDGILLEDYARSQGRPYSSEEIGVAPLFQADDQIRRGALKLDKALMGELSSRGWTPDSAAMQTLLKEMRARIVGFDHLDSVTKIERLLAVANIMQSERALGWAAAQIR